MEIYYRDLCEDAQNRLLEQEGVEDKQGFEPRQMNWDVVALAEVPILERSGHDEVKQIDEVREDAMESLGVAIDELQNAGLDDFAGEVERILVKVKEGKGL